MAVSKSTINSNYRTEGFAQNPGTAPVVDEGYPPFWDQINGDIAEYPVKNGKSVINVWNYLDRLKIYKILITETNKYFVQFGKNNTGNVLWALALFYGKLYETARFSEPTNTFVCAYEAGSPGCISINSGWGGISFYVVTMNFLGAVEAGLFKDAPHEVELVAAEEHRSEFCYSIEECRALYPQAMDVATRFYKYLLSRKPSSFLSDVPVYDTDEDTAITYMWEAHQAALDVSRPKLSYIDCFLARYNIQEVEETDSIRLERYILVSIQALTRWQYSSKAERDFANDFLTAIQFCEAAVYRPYFKSSSEFLVGYPHRLLTDQENPIIAKDFSAREKAQLSTVKLISNMNKVTGGQFLTVWKKAMNTSKVSQALARMFINGLLLIPISL
nr:protein LEG1 homolog [Cavia porcellus]